MWRTTLGEATAHYRDKEPRGEFVLVVEGAAPAPEPQEFLSLEEAVALAQELAGQGALPQRGGQGGRQAVRPAPGERSTPPWSAPRRRGEGFWRTVIFS